MDEGSLMDQADSQFDFDGAGSGNTGDAGFGSGWEDDLESMLLKGMKKKAQRRIAIMVGVGTLGILLGALWGYGFASATQPDNAPVVVDGGANAWTACTDCEDCTPMHGHDYTGWALACSGIKCAGCFGGDGGCPHGCICTVTCDHYSGWDTNELVVGEDNLYLVTCDDGEWVGEEQCSPGSGSCKDSHGNETALCLNHDDCSPNPCQNGGICSDALHNHTCSCHPGFSGMDCEIDEDECNSNPCGIATPVTTPLWDAVGAVRCYESGSMRYYDPERRGFNSINGPQPPPGYPQYDAAEGKFGTGKLASRYVCVCSSRNHTDAAYIGSGAWDTRTSYGTRCQYTTNFCASSPCQNGGACVEQGSHYNCSCPGGWTGLTCEDAAHAVEPPAGGTIHAVAAFDQDGVFGSISLSQNSSDPTAPTSVVVDLTGLRDGPNPWHIHSTAVTIVNANNENNCSAASTGGHFLENSPHSDIWDLGAAMSQLGAEASLDAQPGEVRMTATDATLPLSGPQSVVYKSIVIHKATHERWVCATITPAGGVSCGTMSANFANATDDKMITGHCDGAPGDVCYVHCIPGYSTNGRSVYTCRAAGGWEDELKASPRVSCTDINECVSNPCHNNGTCADSTTDRKTPLDHYRCTCQDGYFGDNCDADRDECESNPCGHCPDGGCCTQGKNMYTCECNPGYEGVNCDQDVDECASAPCQNGGACADSMSNEHEVVPGVFRCDCVGSYHGELCDTHEDFCSPQPCSNGGTCTGTEDAYSCHCVDGYDGENCDNDIDECASGPCQNKAHCDQGIASYNCTCAHGFTGTNCDASEATNNCDSSPCQNAGHCDPAATAYTCTCADGFVGDHCETADPCRPANSCHNGTCDGSTGTVVCHCSLGWFGDACDEETDECGSNPCENGASCTDGDNAYSCVCAEGYAGDNCNEADCTPNPCENNGTCSAGDNGAAACTCQAGYYGDMCQSETDECDSTPCMNGGECTDAVNSFMCTCAAGYGGPTCECGPSQLAVNCTLCEPGKTPNSDKTECEDCPEGSAGTDGTCEQCPAGKKAAPATRSTSCDDCTGSEAGNDGTCSSCPAGQYSEDHQSCIACAAGQYRTADDTAGSCTQCQAGHQPNGGLTDCVACPEGKAGDTGICASCLPGKEGAPTYPAACTPCGEGASSTDGRACIVCSELGQVANPEHTDCVDPAQEGESGTCELTTAPMCLVIDSVTMTRSVPSKHFNNNAAHELVDGFVRQSDNEYIASLQKGPCNEAKCGNDGAGGVVVTSTGKHVTSFTVEFAVDSPGACQGLIDLFTAQLADPSSALLNCTGGHLHPCWSLNTTQTLDTHCITE